MYKYHGIAHKNVTYPVIVKEIHENGYQSYVVRSPYINGMITEGRTLEEAMFYAQDALGTMICGETEYPPMQFSPDWQLDEDEFITYVSVDMERYELMYGILQSVDIQLSQPLINFVKEQELDISLFTQNELLKLYYAKTQWRNHIEVEDENEVAKHDK